jgi:hypothetical protein
MRFMLPETGRFISADTIVPDPMNPQSFDRYSYVLGNPPSSRDPTGHCPGQPGDGVNDNCWNFLLDGDFCHGSGVDICNGGDWTSRLIYTSIFSYDGVNGDIDNTYMFDVAWTLDELRVLRRAISSMILTFDNQPGLDWRDTPIATVRYRKKPKISIGGSRAGIWSNSVVLATVTERNIWHETAHRLDFGSGRLLSTTFDGLAGICNGAAICTNPTPDGLYYRDYGRNTGHFNFPGYMLVFGRMEVAADGFAAWIYHSTYGSYPANWVYGVAKNHHPPRWESIITYAALSVSAAYGDGR